MVRENEASWVSNLGALRRGKNGKGWAFDVGVDGNRDGFGPMEAVGELIRKVREEEKREGVEEGKGVRFVLSELPYPPLFLFLQVQKEGKLTTKLQIISENTPSPLPLLHPIVPGSHPYPPFPPIHSST
jgi:hypothetical protein